MYLLGTLFVEVSVGLNTFINTQGRPGIAMCSVIIGALLNIGLDPLFIFVFGMGVKGAALATIISQAMQCLVGGAFPDFAESHFEVGTQVYASRP